MFKNLSLEALGVCGTQNETIELALSHGFRGIDLDIKDFSQQAAERGLPHARRLLDSAKLKIGGFALPVDWLAEDAGKADMARLPELAKLAADLGCTRALAQIAPGSDELPFHQNFELHRKRFADIATVLEPFGIRLGVGFNATPEAGAGKHYQFIQKFDQVLMLLGLVGKRNVGVLLDIWHLHVVGNGISDLAKLSKDQIVAVRVADFPPDIGRENASETNRLLPGETGVIDIPAWLTWLADLGYDGPVTPYPDKSYFQNVRRDEIGKRVGQATDRVWKAAGLSATGKRPAVASL